MTLNLNTHEELGKPASQVRCIFIESNNTSILPCEQVNPPLKYLKLKKVNFEIYIADRKATTCI